MAIEIIDTEWERLSGPPATTNRFIRLASFAVGQWDVEILYSPVNSGSYMHSTWRAPAGIRPERWERART